MDIENKLLNEFLRISSSTRNNVFQEAVKAINGILDCYYCTLWKINNKANSLSLLASDGYERNESDKEKFVHFIKDSFAEHVIRDASTDGKLVIDDIMKHAGFESLKLKEIIKFKRCKKCIAILIPTSPANPTHNNEIYYEALLFIYPKHNIKNENNIISVIQKYLSLSFANYYLSRKERLTSAIIKLHEKKGTKDIGSIIHPIINEILKEFIKYEAASAFVWDPFLSRLNLSATTGIEGNLKKKDIFYNLGQGLTGQVARDMDPRIVNLPIDKAIGHEKKHKEVKKNKGKSFLYIPIKSVVNNSLLGVLRFVNRINPISGVVDYFSNTDLKLLDHVSYLIGLYMEFDQSEKMMSGFSKHMSHEILTPAIGIRGLASRLVRNKDDVNFLDKYLSDYSQSLFEYSTLQVAQTKNIEYIWRGDKDQPKNIIYNVEKVDLREIIENCKKLVFPLIRDESLVFDNIEVSGNFPQIYVDRFAFEPVFLNLLTNSIKYRKRHLSANFKVKIAGHLSEKVTFPDDTQDEGFLIQILDYGLGIPLEEKDKIFYLGYRRKDIEKLEIRGLGMGLTVVKRVLDDFFCNIWLHNNENPTEFRIFIPKFLNTISYTKEDRWISPPK